MRKLLFCLAATTVFQAGTYAQENTIPETGNVGIGTTNPETALDVKGKVKIDSALVVRDSVTIQKTLRVEEDVHFLGTTYLNQAVIQGGLISNAPAVFNNHLRFNTLEEISDLANKSVVLTDGEGNAKKTGLDTFVSVLKSGIYAEPFQPGFDCKYDPSASPSWANGPYKIFSSCPEVNVGIGTDVPRVNLDVRGTTYSHKLSINSDPLAMGHKLFHLKADYSHPSQSNHTLFLIENHERTLFQVSNNGIVRSREIIINLDQAWPDYVFSPGYRLAPLKEVASFIEQNGHLPNVPSAAQVEQQGIPLGEMNRILLEKVEELTLHLIEQQRLIEAQRQVLEEQQQRIEALEIKQ